MTASEAEPVEGRYLILAARVAREAMDCAASAHSLAIADLLAPGRSRAVVSHARQIAMYLAHVVGGMSITEISIAFGRERTTVTHACHAIEDRRESRIFDEQMSAMEAMMRARVDPLFDRRRVRARPPVSPPSPRRLLSGLTQRRGPRLKSRSQLRGRRRRS